MVLADLECPGAAAPSSFETVICRDCAFAMVVRSTAAGRVASFA
jgi:hypothetical protein